ncbi:PilZ domain-containing protein [Butyrivibrio sp. X503]|uniref:PilZ domain-containing protein n=1 Tax=Butyrivibrio sp. X503 TaxID=2364878 RepID=UPI000EA99CFC|nr:PilZ domain-containing protein [Butyrivibrio sp. X503]RKM56279.1 PilZ domain-containing protein [Butyrivibrio sp. X503]
MNVSEIANGSEVKIHASVGGHGIVLMTEAIFGCSAGLLVKPMEYFGKYMRFLEPSNIQIRNKRDGRVYKFVSTTVTPVRTRYGNFHLIRCLSELEPDNLRRAERFFIDKLGIMSINGDNINLKNCTVHDISMRGISLVLDKGTVCNEGDRIDVRFRYGSSLHNYELSTVVVRNFNIGKKKAIGCSISEINVDLIGFLASMKNEKHPNLDEIPETNLNPKLTQKEQIKEVEEDIAKNLFPEKRDTITITSRNPYDPDTLPHISRDQVPEKTLRQKKKEKRESEQAREIENLLDLRNI